MKSHLVLKRLCVTLALTALSISAQSQTVVAVMNNEKQTSKATVAAALVGTWRSGDITLADLDHTQPGEWQNRASTGMFLSIQSNGVYRFGSAESIYLNGSEARHMLYQEGKIALIDKRLVLQPTSGYTEVLENCAPARPANSQSGSNDLAASVFAFEIVADKNVPYRPTLVLTSEAGEKIALVVDGL